jgi:hypothetical protein
MKAIIFTVPLLAGLGLAAGCQHARVISAPRAPVSGASSFQFVEQPLAAAAGEVAQLMTMVREPMDVKYKAEPIEPLATPVYPRAALGRVRVPMMVGVRISVDGTGRVAQVGGSLVAFSSGGEFAEEFREAVEAAMAQWRFHPAELRHLVPKTGKSGRGGYWQVTQVQPTDDAFDVAFTFSTKGEVLTEGLR